MLFEQTFTQLRELRLTGTADALEEQQAVPDVQSLSFEDRLGLLKVYFLRPTRVRGTIREFVLAPLNLDSPQAVWTVVDSLAQRAEVFWAVLGTEQDIWWVPGLPLEFGPPLSLRGFLGT
jgi:hypothetical protein